MSTNAVQIKKNTPEQIPAILAVQNYCGLEGWGQDWYEQNVGNPSVILLTAQSQSQTIGFILAQVLADEVEVYLVAVLPKFQRQKIASRLLQTLLECARLRKLTNIFLEVRASNLAAQKLYESFAFTLVGKRHHYYQNPSEDAFIYRVEI